MHKFLYLIILIKDFISLICSALYLKNSNQKYRLNIFDLMHYVLRMSHSLNVVKEDFLSDLQKCPQITSANNILQQNEIIIDIPDFTIVSKTLMLYPIKYAG